MPPRDYTDARDVFSYDLQVKVYEAMGRRVSKVTIRPHGSPPSLSERKLGEDLMHELRCTTNSYIATTYYFGAPCASPSSQTATSATTPATPPPRAQG